MTTFVGTYALNNTFINHHLKTTLHTTFLYPHKVAQKSDIYIAT